MKNVMCIVAIVMSLVGTANFAMAQSSGTDMGVVTGSESNRAAHANGCEYTSW